MSHNLAKVEVHTIDGQRRTVCVHRKGAARALPPGHADLPDDLVDIGQPVLVPGSMGDGCLRQAVLGLVATFAHVEDVTAADSVPFSVPQARAEDLLVVLLEEVVYLLDAENRVPVDVTITSTADGSLQGHFLMGPATVVDQHGAVPKAITHHGLELRRNGGGWRCRVTIDV